MEHQKGRPAGARTVTEALRPASRLEVVVPFFTTKGALHALKTAADLAAGLNATIRVLAAQIVPYPLPLTAPPVSAAFAARRFHTLAAGASIDTRIEVRLCRDRETMFESALKPGSLVVLDGTPGWWPTAERRLARRLERLGHQIVYAGAL